MANASLDEGARHPPVPGQRSIGHSSSSSGRSVKRTLSLAEIRAMIVEEGEKLATEPAGNSAPATPHRAAAGAPPQTLTLGRQASSGGASQLARKFSIRTSTLRGESQDVPAALPVLPISSALSARLQRECARSVALLERLQRPAYSRRSSELASAPAMPSSALRVSKVRCGRGAARCMRPSCALLPCPRADHDVCLPLRYAAGPSLHVAAQAGAGRVMGVG